MKFTKKRIVIAAVAALVLIPAGTAFAYWTVGGSGSGTASTGTSVDIKVNQTSTLTAMYPGDTAQTLSGDFDNTNSGPVYVGTVTVSIDSVTKATGAAAGTCDATNYTVSNPVMTVGHEVASGTSVDSWSGATIKFNNKTTSQDGCKGAKVNLTYAIS